MPFKLVIALSNEAQKHIKQQQQNIISKSSTTGLASATTYHIDLFIEISDSSQDTQNTVKDILKAMDVSHLKFFDYAIEFASDRIVNNTKTFQADVLVNNDSVQRLKELRNKLMVALKGKITFKSLTETVDWEPRLPLLTYKNNFSLADAQTHFKATSFKVVSISAKEQHTSLFSEPLLQLIPKERTFDGVATQYKDDRSTNFIDFFRKKSMYGSTDNMNIDLRMYTPAPNK